MANVELHSSHKVSPFRKIAIGTWQTAYDPSVYGTMRLRMDKTVAYIEQFRTRYGKKLTMTHLVAKAAAKALSVCPEANAVLRFNKIYPRKTIDISLLVLLEIDGKKDLSATKINDIDKKSLVEIIDEVEERVVKIRARKDKELESTRQSMGMIPAFFINFF